MIPKILLVALLILNLCNIAFATNWCDNANCQGCWLMDYDENPIRDDSGEGRTGTVGGNPVFTVSCKFNGCYEFDGTNDSFTIVMPDTTDNFTFVVWAKPDTDNNSGMNLINKSTATDKPNYEIRFLFTSTNSQVDFIWKNAADSTWRNPYTTDNITINDWNHVAVVHNFGVSGTAMYINGVNRYSTGTSADEPYLTGQTTKIGERVDGAHDFDGFIDDIAVFHMATDSTDINSIMTDGLVPAAGGRTRRLF